MRSSSFLHKFIFAFHSNDIEVVDALDNQHVLVVSATQDQIDKLSNEELIDYVEPEPIRRLYSQ